MLLHAGTPIISPAVPRGRQGTPQSQMRKARHIICSKITRASCSPGHPPPPPPGPHRPALSLVGNLSISSNRRFVLSKTKSTAGFQPSSVLKYGRCHGTCLMNPHGQTKEGQAAHREAQPKRGARLGSLPEGRPSWGAPRGRSPDARRLGKRWSPQLPRLWHVRAGLQILSLQTF